MTYAEKNMMRIRRRIYIALQEIREFRLLAMDAQGELIEKIVIELGFGEKADGKMDV